MGSVNPPTTTFLSYPAGFFVKKEKLEELTKNWNDPVFKIAAFSRLHLSALYAMDTGYYAGRALSSLIQLPMSTIALVFVLIAPDNTVLQKASSELIQSVDGIPALFTNIFKTIVCAAAALNTPFRSADQIIQFYTNCQSDLQTKLKNKSEVKPTEVPRYSELQWISPLVKKAFDAILDQLRHSEKAQKLLLDSLPSAILEGPPGNGKTYIVESLANEIAHQFPEKKVEFCPLKFQKLVKSHVGGTTEEFQKFIDDLLLKCKKGVLPVLFIDEIDTYFVNREWELGEVKEYETLLNMMMEFVVAVKKSGGIVLAASNNIDNIDKALVRAGRFDRRVEVPKPSPQEAVTILKSMISKIQAEFVSPELQNMSLSDETRLLPLLGGLSVAEIEETINQCKNSILSKNEPISLLNLIDHLKKCRTSRKIQPQIFPSEELTTIFEKLLLSLGAERVDKDIISGATDAQKEALKVFIKNLTPDDLVKIFEQLPKDGYFSLGYILGELYDYHRTEKKLATWQLWQLEFVRMKTPGFL